MQYYSRVWESPSSKFQTNSICCYWILQFTHTPSTVTSVSHSLYRHSSLIVMPFIWTIERIHLLLGTLHATDDYPISHFIQFSLCVTPILVLLSLMQSPIFPVIKAKEQHLYINLYVISVLIILNWVMRRLENFDYYEHVLTNTINTCQIIHVKRFKKELYIQLSVANLTIE